MRFGPSQRRGPRPRPPPPALRAPTPAPPHSGPSRDGSMHSLSEDASDAAGPGPGPLQRPRQARGPLRRARPPGRPDEARGPRTALEGATKLATAAGERAAFLAKYRQFVGRPLLVGSTSVAVQSLLAEGGFSSVFACAQTRSDSSSRPVALKSGWLRPRASGGGSGKCARGRASPRAERGGGAKRSAHARRRRRVGPGRRIHPMGLGRRRGIHRAADAVPAVPKGIALRRSAPRRPRRRRRPTELWPAHGERAALTLLEGTLRGVEALHDQVLFAHRDVKPANVLLGRGPGGEGVVPLLMDFGSARRTEHRVDSLGDARMLADEASSPCSAPSARPSSAGRGACLAARPRRRGPPKRHRRRRGPHARWRRDGRLQPRRDALRDRLRTVPLRAQARRRAQARDSSGPRRLSGGARAGFGR